MEDQADEARLVVLERVFGCFAVLLLPSLLLLMEEGECRKELALRGASGASDEGLSLLLPLRCCRRGGVGGWLIWKKRERKRN